MNEDERISEFLAEVRSHERGLADDLELFYSIEHLGNVVGATPLYGDMNHVQFHLKLLNNITQQVFGPDTMFAIIEAPPKPDGDEIDAGDDSDPELEDDPDNAGAEPDSAQSDSNEANPGPENAQSDEHQRADAPGANRGERRRQADAERKANKRPKVNYAVAYARKGCAVFPCHNIDPDGECSCGKLKCASAGKHPRWKNWQNEATTDEAKFRPWWTEYPDSNIGVACGERSNLTVLDVDGIVGRDTLRQLELEHGELPETPIAITGSGGAHYYFRHVPGLTNAVRFAEGLDLRNDGGLVVGVGSRTEGEYYWEAIAKLGEVQPAAMPQWLIETSKTGTNRNGKEGFRASDKPIHKGQGRNNELYRLGRSLKAQNLPDKTIEAALRSFDKEQCRPPLQDENKEEFEALLSHVLTQGDRENFRRGNVKEAPRPLFREIVPGEPFPTEALGEFGAAAAIDLHRATQAHSAICGQAILSKMNLVTMGHVDIDLPHGESKPVSEFFVTIAESGERKTSADNRAAAGIVEYQNEHDDEYRREYFEYKNALEAYEKERNEILAWKPKDKQGRVTEVSNLRELRKEKLDALGEPPEPPVTNMVLIGADPTYEGLYRFYREGGASIAGQFTSEGAGLVGGHSMTEEARLRTVAGFSLLWDGAPLPRIRGSESHSQVRDRRLAMHIQIQPRIAGRLYADPDLNDQGFLSRVLTIMSDTSVGKRLYVPCGEYGDLQRFTQQTKALLARSFNYLNPARPREGLRPRVLKLGEEAKALWIRYHDEIEAGLKPGGRWFPIKGLARKGPEHATRLGATIAIFDNPDIETMGAEPMRAGIALMQFYLTEALRIREGLTIDEELKKAQDLLEWLLKVWQEDNHLISLPDIYQLGPYAIQNKDAAEKVVKILEEHGHLERCDPGEVNGKFRRNVWKIVREPEQ